MRWIQRSFQMSPSFVEARVCTLSFSLLLWGVPREQRKDFNSSVSKLEVPINFSHPNYHNLNPHRFDIWTSAPHPIPKAFHNYSWHGKTEVMYVPVCSPQGRPTSYRTMPSLFSPSPKTSSVHCPQSCFKKPNSHYQKHAYFAITSTQDVASQGWISNRDILPDNLFKPEIISKRTVI